jgi:hypothetical protein
MNLKINIIINLKNINLNKDLIYLILKYIGDEKEIIKSYKSNKLLNISDYLYDLNYNIELFKNILISDNFNKKSKKLFINLGNYMNYINYFIDLNNQYDFDYKKTKYEVIYPNIDYYIKKNHNKNCIHYKKKFLNFNKLDKRNIVNIILLINKTILNYITILSDIDNYYELYNSIKIKNRIHILEENIISNLSYSKIYCTCDRYK